MILPMSPMRAAESRSAGGRGGGAGGGSGSPFLPTPSPIALSLSIFSSSALLSPSIFRWYVSPAPLPRESTGSATLNEHGATAEELGLPTGMVYLARKASAKGERERRG